MVGAAKDALAKLAELAELDQVEVGAMDLSGTTIELATLQAEANQTPKFQKHGRRAPFPARRSRQNLSGLGRN